VSFFLFFFLPVFPHAVAKSVQRLDHRMKASDAVRKSKVKVAGRDVVATWKILIAMVLLPSVHSLYTLVAYWQWGERWAVLYFFFAPFLCAAGVKCTETGVRAYRGLSVLFLALRSGKLGEGLLKQRNALKEKIRQVCDTHV
jgi:glycerol-3-phosphate O-acyltransferase/dihydroxyacetone phosphate acyltransferase